MQGPTLSNAKPKYRLLVSQSQSPFLIPATWLLSDLYPTSLYYCDHSHQHFLAVRSELLRFIEYLIINTMSNSLGLNLGTLPSVPQIYDI